MSEVEINNTARHDPTRSETVLDRVLRAELRQKTCKIYAMKAAIDSNETITKSEVGAKKRILIVGVGNVLHQDDGFGVEVVQQLQAGTKLPDYVDLIETGIGGISFVQELYDGYEALLLIDTVSRGGKPGHIYWLEAEVGDINELPFEQKSDFLADIHFANPNRALMLARALNILPKQVYILGCEPAVIGGFEMSLSKVVQEAIPKAVSQIENWSINFYKENVCSTTTN